ncbi:hypothetical protein BDV27DRAFT_12268 [Aspergillus caelatus]|uniref:Uncharacterized protein n=1 Tax=Aspergillus caelatus TaxID=61420 RepID=A0A5N7A182_9EURO|nr:uncharacterized protein BDV27DRAFT_12268 [Aspergillus caelatus]KAE8362959.1 hypothetical protein BDV27DRAFT_12268 [Aspergillus caelatus]
MSTDSHLSISNIKLMSNPHSFPLSSMRAGTRKTETQNNDDNETGRLAVTSTTISYSPQPDNISRPEFAIRIANSNHGNVEGSLEEDDDDDEPPQSIIHVPPGFNDFVGVPAYTF